MSPIIPPDNMPEPVRRNIHSPRIIVWAALSSIPACVVFVWIAHNWRGWLAGLGLLP